MNESTVDNPGNFERQDVRIPRVPVMLRVALFDLVHAQVVVHNTWNFEDEAESIFSLRWKKLLHYSRQYSAH